MGHDGLWVTSTGFDSILRLDLESGLFDLGLCFRGPERNGLGLYCFDPRSPEGPDAGDIFHVNMAYSDDSGLYVCGTGLKKIYEVSSMDLIEVAVVPRGTHNARPLDGGIVFNDTASEKVVMRQPVDKVSHEFRVPRYPEEMLTHNDLGPDHARQAFGRGLAIYENHIIAGSSPATVTVHDMDSGEIVKSINLTMDVRNAIHGLEVWPF